MFEQYKFLFDFTYATRWDFKHNTDEMSLSYYENEDAYYVGNDKDVNKKFCSFLPALSFFSEQISK